MVKFWIELKSQTNNICLVHFLIANYIFHSSVWNMFLIISYDILMMLNESTKKHSNIDFQKLFPKKVLFGFSFKIINVAIASFLKKHKCFEIF